MENHQRTTNRDQLDPPPLPRNQTVPSIIPAYSDGTWAEIGCLVPGHRVSLGSPLYGKTWKKWNYNKNQSYVILYHSLFSHLSQFYPCILVYSYVFFIFYWLILLQTFFRWPLVIPFVSCLRRHCLVQGLIGGGASDLVKLPTIRGGSTVGHKLNHFLLPNSEKQLFETVAKTPLFTGCCSWGLFVNRNSACFHFGFLDLDILGPFGAPTPKGFPGSITSTLGGIHQRKMFQQKSWVVSNLKTWSFTDSCPKWFLLFGMVTVVFVN